MSWVHNPIPMTEKKSEKKKKCKKRSLMIALIGEIEGWEEIKGFKESRLTGKKGIRLVDRFITTHENVEVKVWRTNSTG